VCGRFNLLATPEEVQDAFQLEPLAHYETSYNIPPGQFILNMTQLPDRTFQGAYAYWGLVPSWSKDRKHSSHLINARAETLAEKPSFRAAFKKRRCLIPATGFYEWQQNAQAKQAYHITRQDQQLFAFAGLWEYWEDGTETLYSCTIITTAANALMQPIHERMPVIIAKEDYRQWLDDQQSLAGLQHVLSTDSYSGMTVKPISPWVNNPKHNDRRCLNVTPDWPPTQPIL
jgi:putative SOS response-associated peptidase YedK